MKASSRSHFCLTFRFRQEGHLEWKKKKKIAYLFKIEPESEIRKTDALTSQYINKYVYLQIKILVLYSGRSCHFHFQVFSTFALYNLNKCGYLYQISTSKLEIRESSFHGKKNLTNSMRKLKNTKQTQELSAEQYGINQHEQKYNSVGPEDNKTVQYITIT